MFGCECYCWDNHFDLCPVEPKRFSLPSPLPQWPQGKDFATGRICLGEIEVTQITKFEKIWSCGASTFGKSKRVSFYKPIEIPQGFFSLGDFCQPDDENLRGYVLAARDLSATKSRNNEQILMSESPALVKPLNYTLVWTTDSHFDGSGYIWLPNAPAGYRATGFVVTNVPDAPGVEELRCVREDLTDDCETWDTILDFNPTFSKMQFQVSRTRPCERGMLCSGVSVGTFFCCSNLYSEDEIHVACLKNLDRSLSAMPNLDQIHALIKNYGPTVFFHPDEVYLPSSVPWFFKNGALLYEDEKDKGVVIDSEGSNLPAGGENDGQFWLDLPENDDKRSYVKSGNMESAELYVHVKPALGGTFTDIVMWIFCPFNGPATIKVGLMNIALNRIGQHVGDWEHFTLRVNNFTGELWRMYCSEHSGGEWVDVSELEFIQGNKPIVYSSKNGHASFPHAGCYIQGSSKIGMGLRNDCAQSKYFIDASVKYQIIAAEYLGEGVVQEPPWLQYMREWGPMVVYDSRSELDKIIKHLPFFVRFSVESLFELFPTELYGEEGPTGPKEKDNWLGDERS